MDQAHFGRFYISDRMIQTHPECAREALRDIIVVRAEFDPSRIAYSYMGVCDEFHSEPMCEAPLYTIDVEMIVKPDEILYVRTITLGDG